MVQGYDSHFVTIKSWSATASGAALGLALVHSLWLVAFIAAMRVAASSKRTSTRAISTRGKVFQKGLTSLMRFE